jgi:tetratricopeptide (TPR) repeat protein
LYLRALLLDPGHADAHCNYASLRVDVGRATTAEEHYRKALELDDKHAGALFNLALLLQDQGKEGKQEAAFLYEQLLEVEPKFFGGRASC